MATEDFTTYDETDPGSDFTVTASRITVVDLDKNAVSHISDSKGVNHFSGDFSHKLTLKPQDCDNVAVGFFWTMANQQDSQVNIDSEGDSMFGVEILGQTGTDVLIFLIEIDSGSFYNASSITLTEDTVYYVNIARDDSYGSYGRLTLNIYSDSGFSSHVSGSPKTLDLHTSKKDFEYIYGVQSRGSDTGPKADFYVENLDLQESGSVEVSAGVDALVLTEYGPTVNKAINLTAGVDALTLTEYNPNVNKAINFTAGIDALTLTEYNPTVNIGISVSAGVDVLTLTEYNPTVNKAINLTAGVDALVLTEYNPTVTVTAGTSVSAGVDALILTEYNPDVKKDISFIAGVDALILTEYNPTVQLNVNVAAGVDALALTEYAATVKKDISITAGIDALILTEYNATVLAGELPTGRASTAFTSAAPGMGFTGRTPGTGFTSRKPNITFSN